MTTFADVPEQPEAKRLLEAALAESPSHAYLFHGPAGVGKHTAALAFAGALLGDPRRVDARTHPDLYVIEPLGEMIRIDDIRALRHDLHMRPFEADRRVYLCSDAHRMNDEAADALLKDLEEPPSYATLVLVADELGPLPETILSRCQLVPFRRLSRAAVASGSRRRRPSSTPRRSACSRRVAGGRLDRARAAARPRRPRARRAALLDAARGVYRDASFDPSAAAHVLLDGSRAAGRRGARARAGARRRPRSPGARGRAAGATRRARRRAGRAPRRARGPRGVVPRPRRRRRRGRRVRSFTPTGSRSSARTPPPVRARARRRRPRSCARRGATLEEFNLNPSLALEALFVRVRRAFA